MGIDIWRMELTLLRTMRGEDKKQSSMLMLMSPETGVPQTHPLRAIKKLADEALAKLSRLRPNVRAGRSPLDRARCPPPPCPRSSGRGRSALPASVVGSRRPRPSQRYSPSCLGVLNERRVGHV